MKHFLLCLLLLAGCKREPAPEFVDLTFQIPFALTPERDTVAVGDTLWLTADFSDQLRDFYTGQRYPVPPANFRLRTLLGLFRLTLPTRTLANQPAATEDFTFVNKVGAVARQAPTFNEVSYVHAQGRYHLRVGLIPQRRGVFSVNFLDGWLTRRREEKEPDLSYLDLGKTADGLRRQAVFRSFFHYINEGRTNFELYKQHCAPVSLNYPNPGNINGEQEGTLTFVVR
ncbi:hypothetical protein [Hymenobacter elongatus]|uniref:Uncharacterized protein n=1 Tax=Hymenobacter elongatus TaxID=877208 RepID=A0A4Z0PIQ1_9BACT|nr:hypothetical protein [Hymenobacter elongatus]TGE15264.1 hypothetical protein E5J99_12870 [Hymenobacter elongatus]